jgi:hypothetical protein
VRAEFGVEGEKLKSGKKLEFKSKPEPFTPRRVRHPASFNRAWVRSGAARKGSPPAGRLF